MGQKETGLSEVEWRSGAACAECVAVCELYLLRCRKRAQCPSLPLRHCSRVGGGMRGVRLQVSRQTVGCRCDSEPPACCCCFCLPPNHSTPLPRTFTVLHAIRLRAGFDWRDAPPLANDNDRDSNTPHSALPSSACDFLR